MTPNVPLMLKVLEHVTAHPEEHDQDVWAQKRTVGTCGTVGCLAYHAVVMGGLDVRWDEVWLPFFVPGATHEADSVTDGRSIEDVAAELLGLRDEQAHEMFHHATTLRQLWGMAAVYTGGEIVPPPEFA